MVFPFCLLGHSYSTAVGCASYKFLVRDTTTRSWEDFNLQQYFCTEVSCELGGRVVCLEVLWLTTALVCTPNSPHDPTQDC